MEIVFNFNKTKKVHKRKEPRYKTVSKNVIGVCCFDKNVGFYVVPIDSNTSYIFTSRSYLIKNNTKYSAQLFDNKFITIKELKNNKEYIDAIYLPFMCGVICKGNIIFDTLYNNYKFDLIDTTVNWNIPLAKISIKAYIEDYENNLNSVLEWKKQNII